jgi:hypothetical protein
MTQVTLRDLQALPQEVVGMAIFLGCLSLVMLAVLGRLSYLAIGRSPTPGTRRFRAVFLLGSWSVLLLLYMGSAIILLTGGSIPVWTGLATGPILFLLVVLTLWWTANRVPDSTRAQAPRSDGLG